MTGRTLKKLLWTVSFAFAWISALAILSVVVESPEASQHTSVNQEPDKVTFTELPISKSTDMDLDADDFKFVWTKRLRLPLVDAAPVAEAKTSPLRQLPPPRLIEFTLISTFVEDDQGKRRAVIQFPGNSRRLVAVGQALDDIEGSPVVDAIQDRLVTLRIGEQRVTKEIPIQSEAFSGNSENR